LATRGRAGGECRLVYQALRAVSDETDDFLSYVRPEIGLQRRVSAGKSEVRRSVGDIHLCFPQAGPQHQWEGLGSGVHEMEQIVQKNVLARIWQFVEFPIGRALRDCVRAESVIPRLLSIVSDP
jgi:hypothetical protein